LASQATLYRFRLNLSDIDRSFYETIDIRVPMHPSESEDYLMTRVLAFALNFEDALEMMPGLCTGDDPAIRLLGQNGETLKWIDIGSPSSRRIHKASKASRSVRIYTYKNPENLKKEAAGETVHRASEIEIYALDPDFLKQLASNLKRDNSWSIIHDGGELVITIGEETYMGSIAAHRLETKT
jgi:uncharacterized protein YaeQ